MRIFLKFINSAFMIPGLSQVLLWMDSWIYFVADLALRGFFDLVKLSGAISALDSSVYYITKRMMVLAGVYGLFRLAFMLINYIIEPDKLSKASSQGASIVKNVVIAIILLVTTPFIFQFMGELQNKIIDSRIIPKVIYGTKKNNDVSMETDQQESKRFVNKMFLLFYDDNGSCDNYTSSVGGICGAYKKVSNGEAGITEFLKYPVSTTFSGFTYVPIVSGIMGIFLCYYFITFMISMAIRILELIVLQILSPIPIIMSIDPSSKNQVQRYAKTYFDIWIQVFIRIFTFYLAFVVCNLVTNLSENIGIMESSLNSGLLFEINFLVRAIIYVGILKGAKEIPKLLDKALGIKIDALPGQNFGTVLKGAIGGYAGTIGGGIAGGIAGGSAGLGGVLKGVGIGAATGGFRGATIAAKAKNVGEVISGTTGAIKGSFGTSKGVLSLGMLAYARGAVENKFGGQDRDKATLEKFDKEKESQDKEIEKYRHNMEVSNSAANLKDRITDRLTSNFESKRGTLEDALENNGEINSIKQRLAQTPTSDMAGRNQIMQELASKRNEITNDYNAEKNDYFRNQISDATNQNLVGSVTSEVEDLRDLLNDYNTYVEEQGMTDRKITDFSTMSNVDSKHETYIKENEQKVKDAEQKKKEIDAAKKAFKESDGYKRRNDRKPDDKPKPWDNV